jgi:hypothetical protein
LNNVGPIFFFALPVKGRTMTHSYEFTLVIDGDLADEDVVDALCEAGCDDATFGIEGGLGYGDFNREAPSFANAVTDAIWQVESVGDLRVRRLEPDARVCACDS